MSRFDGADRVYNETRELCTYPPMHYVRDYQKEQDVQGRQL